MVNDLRRKAYNQIIYMAFLDIKNSGTYSEESFYRNFRIAHAFHNLAKSMIHEMRDFNEEEFWESIRGLENQFGLFHYRKMFENGTSAKAD